MTRVSLGSNSSNNFYPKALVAPQGDSQPTYAYLLQLHSARRMNEMSQQDIYPWDRLGVIQQLRGPNFTQF